MEEKTVKKSKGFKVRGFRVLENECIWMKAGVVNFRICDMAYDCCDCSFDKAMRKAMGSTNFDEKVNAGWSEAMKKKYTGASRPCRHVLTGRVSQPKICTHNYECHDCAYDQMLDDRDLSTIRPVKPDYLNVMGYRVADDYYYHSGHTWVRVEHGGMAKVGLDDFIMKLFGRAEAVRLPSIGTRLTQGAEGWRIAQGGNEAAVLSPVTGTVLSVNRKVADAPNIMHDDPYGDGWLLIVEPDSPKKNFKKLYADKKTSAWMKKEHRTLMGMLGPDYEKLAATGGEPVDDFFGLHPEIGWDELVKTFLKT